MKKSSILILLAFLALGQTVWAQQVRNIAPKSLPYSYGFEEPDEFNCWTRVNCHEKSKISQNAFYEGDYGFDFYYSTTPPQYLISPQFVGNTGINVSFYYKNTSDTYPETFQVGYSTTTESPNDFSWGEEVTAHDQNTWQLYEAFFPIGTKYVAVKLNSNDQFHLYLDNFNFEPAFCADEDKCELTFELTDTYGDSWNGNAIRVVDEENDFVLATLANEDLDGYSDVVETQTITLAVCDGRQLRFEWVRSDWPEECFYTVTDINGNEVFSGEGAMNEPVSFTPDCTPIFDFEGYWNDGNNWNIGVVPQAGKDVAVKAAATIPCNYCAHVGNIDMQEGGSILIEDGGQLIYSNADVTVTVEKSINAYTVSQTEDEGKANGWYFIASPISTALEPSEVNNMLSDNYDLYRFNQSADSEWENFKNQADHPDFTTLNNGAGYLYANSDDVTLGFTGELKPYSEADGANQVSISTGWNLVGNPFACNVYANQPFYKMNEECTGLSAELPTSTAIAPCEGIIMKATQAGNVAFTKDAMQQSAHPGNIQIVLAEATNTRGAATALDNAIVSFNEGSQLGKFYFGEQNANIYIPQDQEEYAIVSAEAQGELPLNFKAHEDGTYTLTISCQGITPNGVSYLHLIDNLTGNDVDLQATPSYTFEANVTDYESRFKLVFEGKEDNDNKLDNKYNFAFISNGEIIVNEEGMLQVIDMTGRIIVSRVAEGHISTNGMTPGVYVLRLINGDDVKTQKMVLN